MTTDREREGYEGLIGRLRSRWIHLPDVKEASFAIEILMRENEALRATISDMKRDLLELTGGKNDSTRI